MDNITNLPTFPAFGFETSRCNASEHYKDQYKINYARDQKVLDATVKMLGRLNIQAPPRGKPISKAVLDERANNNAAFSWRMANAGKIAGYIPLVGTLVGLFHMTNTLMTPKAQLPNKWQHIARDSIESLSLGFLLLIPDLIVTRYRASHVKKV